MLACVVVAVRLLFFRFFSDPRYTEKAKKTRIFVGEKENEGDVQTRSMKSYQKQVLAHQPLEDHHRRFFLLRVYLRCSLILC